MAENRSQKPTRRLRRVLILKAHERNKGNPPLRSEASKKELLKRVKQERES